MRTLLAAMQLEPLAEAVQVTIYMEGLRAGVARMEVFRVHPQTFEEAVDVALNAEFNFKAARYGTHGYSQSSSDRAVPMDICNAEEEAELQTAEQHQNIRRCLCAVVQNTSAQRVRYANSVRNGNAVTLPLQTRNVTGSHGYCLGEFILYLSNTKSIKCGSVLQYYWS